MGGALEGMRVVDFTRLIPGGLATQLLADLGAEVIKVEEPTEGDYMRNVPPFLEGVSLPFHLVNQGKRSLAVNLKNPDGQAIVHRLLGEADVLVEQFRPGVADGLGVGLEEARRAREDLIYCSFSGFGAEGPYRSRPAHDLNFLALTGAIHMGFSEDRPVLPGVPAADIASGFLAAFAILAAIVDRHRTGRGRYLDVSIFDAALYLNLVSVAEALAEGAPGPGDTFLTGRHPSYDVYETADGRFLTLCALERKFWDRLCDLLGKEDLRGAGMSGGKEAEKARATLREAFRRKTLEEWEARLRAEDVPYAPVLTTAEAVRDPQVLARRMWQEGVAGQTPPSLSHPGRWVPEGPRREGRAPRLGEQSREILGELGFAEADVETWIRRGIVGSPD